MLTAFGKPIVIDSPYLLGDYVEFVAAPERQISAGNGTIIAIVITEDEFAYVVESDKKIYAGVTLEMIAAKKDKHKL